MLKEKIGREELLDSESAAYHGEGTCTFYGTANSNQMLMEAMGFMCQVQHLFTLMMVFERLTIEAIS